MFYKLVSNDIVVDLLREVRYLRYLPRSKRWISTEGFSAHAVLGADNNTIYCLQGRSCPCEDDNLRVMIYEITEEEYNKYANDIALRKKENESLNKRIDTLEATLARQSELIERLLLKLEG